MEKNIKSLSGKKEKRESDYFVTDLTSFYTFLAMLFWAMVIGFMALIFFGAICYN